MDDHLLTVTRLARVLERACGALDSPLTLAQYRLLALIGAGADRAAELAARLALAKPTVSATVDTLVERGLVGRAPASDDRRATTLTITHSGAQTLRAAETKMRAQLDDVIARVPHPELVTSALTALGAALDERRAERHRAHASPSARR